MAEAETAKGAPRGSRPSTKDEERMSAEAELSKIKEAIAAELSRRNELLQVRWQARPFTDTHARLPFLFLSLRACGLTIILKLIIYIGGWYMCRLRKDLNAHNESALSTTCMHSIGALAFP
eukprot:scaffold274403_cov23-Prasinocladus_malaysianus.AAC.2